MNLFSLRDTQLAVEGCRVAIWTGEMFFYPQRIQLHVEWKIEEEIYAVGVVFIDDQENVIERQAICGYTLLPGDILKVSLEKVKFNEYSLEELLQGGD